MRIHQVLMGDVTLPAQHPRAGEPYPLFGFVIEHPSGPVLVDTGAGPGHEAVDRLFSPKEVDFEGALRSVGVERSDVVMVINTHLHFDHTGHNRLFRGVPIVAQTSEYEATHVEGYTVREWIDFPGVLWRLVEGDVEILPGIELLLTASHTPGHQVVVVRGETHVEVIAGQAVQNWDELEQERSFEELPSGGHESFGDVARRIKALNPDRVWFSHDAKTWPSS